MTKIIFHIILILIGLFIIFEKQYFKMIILFSIFSLFAAALYFFNAAPDVAIAEIAVGSAIVPLILIISISKQQNFIIAGDIYKALSHKDFNDLLNDFCDQYDLKLKFLTQSNDQKLLIRGVFRTVNVDLFINYNSEEECIELQGKEASLLMHHLKHRIDPLDNIKIELLHEINKGE